MAEKTIKTRIQNKYDVEKNWDNATFTPKRGEILFYGPDDHLIGDTKGTHDYPRFKVGDGVTPINELPIVDAKEYIPKLNSVKTDVELLEASAENMLFKKELFKSHSTEDKFYETGYVSTMSFDFEATHIQLSDEYTGQAWTNIAIPESIRALTGYGKAVTIDGITYEAETTLDFENMILRKRTTVTGSDAYKIINSCIIPDGYDSEYQTDLPVAVPSYYRIIDISPKSSSYEYDGNNYTNTFRCSEDGTKLYVTTGEACSVSTALGAINSVTFDYCVDIPERIRVDMTPVITATMAFEDPIAVIYNDTQQSETHYIWGDSNFAIAVYRLDDPSLIGARVTKIEEDIVNIPSVNSTIDKSLMMWDNTSKCLVDSTIKQQDNGSIVINEGEASGQHSIAGGSTDKTVIEDLLGSLASTQVTIEKSKANASNAISIGSGNVVNSVGGNAIGVWNTAGCKGYYWKELTNTAGAETSTFALSSKQPALLGSWEAVTSVDWQVGDTICVIDESHFPMCATITAIGTKEVGNILSGKKTTVTITTTKLPFDGEESLVLTTPQNKSICAFYQKTEVSVLNQLDNKRWYPREGAVELGWVATSTGVENLVTGTAAFATGWNNWQSSSFGIVAGRENTSGYSDVTAGVFNKNAGESSLVVGKSNVNEVKAVHSVVGGRNNINKGEASILVGDGLDNTSYNSLLVGARNTINPVENSDGTTTLEGDHIVGGADNTVTGGWNSLVVGAHNELNHVSNAIVGGSYGLVEGDTKFAIGAGFTVNSGVDATVERTNAVDIKVKSVPNAPGSYPVVRFNETEVMNGLSKNFVLGNNDQVSSRTYNSVVTGARNTVGSTSSDGGDHVVAGADNTINSGWNDIVGGSKNTVDGGNNIVSGSENKQSGTNSLLLGEKNVSNTNRSIVAGQENVDVNGSNNLVIGRSLSTSAKTYNSVVAGARNKLDSTAEGGDHLVGGADNTVKGWNNIVGGSFNTTKDSAVNGLVIGNHNELTQSNQLITGQYAKVSDNTLLAVGVGAHETATPNQNSPVHGDIEGHINALEITKERVVEISGAYIGGGSMGDFELKVRGENKIENTASTSIVVGTNNRLYAKKSAVIGDNNSLDGSMNLIAGSYNNTKSTSQNSAVFGQANTSEHKNTLLAGTSNKTTANNQTVVGYMSDASTNSMFTVGGGYQTKEYWSDEYYLIDHPENAFEVLVTSVEEGTRPQYAIKIGDTEITEAQLKKLLKFIDNVQIG